MQRVLQYVMQEVKEGRLSKAGAIELARDIRSQTISKDIGTPSPLLVSDASGHRFVARLSGEERYLRLENGGRVLPDMVHLELARAALVAGVGEGAQAEVGLEQVEWLHPVVVGADGLELYVELFAADDGRTEYEIYSESADEGQVIHSHGSAVVVSAGDAAEAASAVSAAGPAGTLLVQRVWQSRAVAADAAAGHEQHVVVLCGREAWTGAVESAIRSLLPQARCVVVGGDGENVARCYEAAVLQLLDLLQRIVRDKPQGDVLIQAVVEMSGKGALFGGLTGLLKTARLEHPKLKGQLIGVEAQAGAAQIVAALEESARVPDEREIRYRDGQRQVASWAELAPGFAVEVPWRDGGVYLITGGAGGLGSIIAGEIARRVKDAVVVLAGRSELDAGKRAELAALEGLGRSRIEYRRVDVADGAAVRGLVTDLRETYGGISGIIHAAGAIRDSFLLKKTDEDARAVLAPKVLGVVNLDEATRELTLDFMALFGSWAGAFGNVGQADYAAANGFLDGYAAWRNGRVSYGERFGRTVSMAWPLWRDGGMQVDAALVRQQAEAGMLPLSTADGLRAFYQGLAAEGDEIAVLSGELPALRAHLHAASVGTRVAEVEVAETATAIDAQLLAEKTLHRLKGEFAELTKLKQEQIEASEALENYGIDSVLIMQLNHRLAGIFGELSKTLFFEYPTLAAVTGHLVAEHGAACARWTGLSEPRPEQRAAAKTADRVHASEPAAAVSPARRQSASLVSRRGPGSVRREREPIAIVGMSGRYPGAANLEAYWENLKGGKDSISELPPDRWGLEGFYHPDADEAVSRGQSYSKRGGFLAGFAEFDPLFFNISPRDAANIDPQERLFIESCWQALEDGGYTRDRLKVRHDNRVGVFAGITKTGFALHGPELWRQGGAASPHTSFGSVANRVSYVLNLRGPSMPIDTMCSASLTAIHEACEHLYRDECELALAGGVNLYLHPRTYVELCMLRMLSVDGRCKSFGKGGDGFVPGEGVGVVVLKRLSQAVADEDQIHAVIRATSINHGGKTNGYTVPNPVAQKELVRAALAKAQISARSVSYIEAHGTGTELGDPIEISGLTQAFAQDTQERQFCAIGSAKSNIGHLEAAAGIAGLSKVVLQLKHGELVPSLHAGELNPHIDFANSPFVVQRELSAWRRPVVESGGVRRELPRIAGISSFGAGGSNAHVVVEEYVAPAGAERPAVVVSAQHPAIVVLSAKNEERLRERAEQLLSAIAQRPLGDADIADVAYTLQVGREAMECRLGLIATSMGELTAKLQRYLSGEDGIEDLYRGQVKRERETLAALAADEDMAQTIEAWVAKGKYGKLLELWAKGLSFDWQRLYGETKPRRISLPTYPFAKERYWIEPGAKLSPPISEKPAASSEPVSDVQTALVRWACQLLNVPVRDLDAESELGQYGFDSISSVQLINRVNQAYGLELSPKAFYEHPTLAGFARHLAETHGSLLVAKLKGAGGEAVGGENRPASPRTRQLEPIATHAAHRSEVSAWVNGYHALSINHLSQNSIRSSDPLSKLRRPPFGLERPAMLPLSYAQERLLQVHRQQEVGPAFNLPMAVKLIGKLDAVALQASFAEAARRHESLRTRFATLDGNAIQVIEPSIVVELPIFEVQAGEDGARAEEIRRLARELLRRPFDLEAAPLFRVGLIRLGPTAHVLVAVVHHIISDNWSLDVLFREVSTLYAAFSQGQPSPLPDPPIQYADYAVWQKEQVQTRILDRELGYWLGRLSDAPDLNLPSDRPRPPTPSYRGAIARFSFPEQDLAALRGVARREGVTLFTTLFTAFNVVMYRLSGQTDIVIGTPIAGRQSLEVEDAIGFFINMLALRIDLSGEPTYRELLKRVKQTTSDAFEHQELPLATIEAELKSVRDLSRHPLFRVLFSLHKFPAPVSFSGLETSRVLVENNTARRDQSFFVYETRDGLFGVLEYATDLFDTSTIERIIEEFRTVLYRIIADPGCTVPAPGITANAPAEICSDGSAQASLDPPDWGRFREQGHRMLDDMVDYLARIRERPVWQPVPDEVRARFREPLPSAPTDLATVHAEFMRSILPFATGNSHPGFMGWVHGGGNPDGMLAEMLAAGLNANLGGRDHMPIEVEKQIVEWARELFGFPEGATGLFVTGTSMANMIALLVARHAAMGDEVRRSGVSAVGGHLIGYTSSAAHGCISQAMDVAGIGTDALRQIPVDNHHAIDIASLERAIADDRMRGLRPFLIVGTAGTVDIGAVDDLRALAAIAKREAAWFHVDGAFGALGMLTPEIAPRLAGIEQADSVAFDFHKWGQVPYDAGFILVRDGAQHRATFTTPAAYLRRETRGLAGGSPWFCDFGPDLSRGFRALKTWFTIKVHGAGQIGAVISKTCELAQYMRRQIESCPDLELLAPVQLNIVCFRYRCADPNPVNAAIVVDLHESGIAAPSTTVLDGQIAIRAAIVNHRTEARDVDAVLAATIKFGRARTEERRQLQNAGAAILTDSTLIRSESLHAAEG